MHVVSSLKSEFSNNDHLIPFLVANESGVHSGDLCWVWHHCLSSTLTTPSFPFHAVQASAVTIQIRRPHVPFIHLQ